MMLVRNLLARLLLVAIGPLFSGCGSGQDAAPSAVSVWCAAYCNYYARCTGPVNANCVTSCSDSDPRYFQNLRDDYLRKAAPCIEQASCGDTWKVIDTQCYNTAAAMVIGSSTVVDMCEAMAVTFFDCNWSDADLASCTRDFSPWADGGISRLGKCKAVPCDSLDTCINTAFDGSN